MFRAKRCEDVLNDPIFKNPQNMKLLNDFTRLTEKLIELTEKPIGAVSFKNLVILGLSWWRLFLLAVTPCIPIG
jgi:hypothetical protein